MPTRHRDGLGLQCLVGQGEPRAPAVGREAPPVRINQIVEFHESRLVGWGGEIRPVAAHSPELTRTEAVWQRHLHAGRTARPSNRAAVECIQIKIGLAATNKRGSHLQL